MAMIKFWEPTSGDFFNSHLLNTSLRTLQSLFNKMKYAAAIIAMAASVSAECPNACSGHGSCSSFGEYPRDSENCWCDCVNYRGDSHI